MSFRNLLSVLALASLSTASLAHADAPGCAQEAAARQARQQCAASLGLPSGPDGFSNLTPDQRKALHDCLVGKGITFGRSPIYLSCAASLNIPLPSDGQHLDKPSEEKIRLCIKQSCGF